MGRADTLAGISNKQPLKRDAKSVHGRNWKQGQPFNRNWKPVYGINCKACNQPGSGQNQVHYRRAFLNLPICRICWQKMLCDDGQTAQKIIQEQTDHRVTPIPADTGRSTGRRKPWHDDPRLAGIEHCGYVECTCRRKFKTKPFSPPFDEDGNPTTAWGKFLAHPFDPRGRLVQEHNVLDWSDRNPFGNPSQRSIVNFQSSYSFDRAEQAKQEEQLRMEAAIAKAKRRDQTR